MPDDIKPEDQKPAGSDPTDEHKGNPSNSDEYPEGLGDAGKRAIDRMKAERDEEKRKNAALKAENDQLKTANSKNDDPSRNGGKDDKVSNETPAETKTPDQIRDEVTATITEQANARLLRSEVRRLAEGKLSDASDALLFLDVSDLKPNAHGDYDSSAISSKLDDLVKTRPYLAKTEQKFEGRADGGNRGDSTVPGSQISRDALKTMSPSEIIEAQKAGRLKDLLAPN